MHALPDVKNIEAFDAWRAEPSQCLPAALDNSRLSGVETNRAYLLEALALPDFVAGKVHTGLLATVDYRPTTVEVVEGASRPDSGEHRGEAAA